jgi:hypothetical protein
MHPILYMGSMLFSQASSAHISIMLSPSVTTDLHAYSTCYHSGKID